MRALFQISFASALAVGCASPGRAPANQHNVVGMEELARAGDVSLYDALSQLRPTFLRSRGNLPGATTPPAPIQVYIGGMSMGGLDHLRQIVAKSVQEVRFLEPQQANARFGGNNNGGALVIVLR
jgi:hypothetical protein